MRLPRERVSISEVQATDSAVLEKIFEFYDISVGEHFFIKDRPDKEWVIEALDGEDSLIATYDGGKTIEHYGNYYPLIGVASLVNLIGNFDGSFELRVWGKGWLLILGDGIIESTEGDDLVGFLWKTLIDMLTK